MTDHPHRHPPIGRQARPAQRYGGWAVVTGASDGIGRQMARDLAAIGVDVVLVARRAEVLETLAHELGSTHGIATRIVAADLTTPAGVSSVVAQTRDLDVGLLVAAAGFGSAGAFLAQDLPRELDMVRLNIDAVTALAHHFGDRFVTRGRGGIVLFGSLVGFQGTPGSATYAATKAFVQSFGEALHHELAPAGVDVLVSAPGPVDTGFGARARMTMNTPADVGDVARATMRAIGGRRTTVRPGARARVLGYGLGSLPRWLRVRVMRSIMATMTTDGATQPGHPTGVNHPA